MMLPFFVAGLGEDLGPDFFACVQAFAVLGADDYGVGMDVAGHEAGGQEYGLGGPAFLGAGKAHAHVVAATLCGCHGAGELCPNASFFGNVND